MQKSRSKRPVSLRLRRRSFVDSVSFPRWVVSASILLIGFVFWLGAASDPRLKISAGRLASLVYFAVVALGAAWALWMDSGADGRRRRRNVTMHLWRRRLAARR